MKVKVNKAYDQAYSEFRRRFRTVPGRPMEPIQAWKELDELYTRQFQDLLPTLETMLIHMQRMNDETHLEDTAALVQRLQFLKSNTYEVMQSQLRALNQAWQDTYVTVAHDGNFLMTTDLVIGSGLHGSLVTLDNIVAGGTVLCALEVGEGQVYDGAPVKVGIAAGYLHRNGLSSKPGGRLDRMPVGKPRLLYPKLKRD